MSTQDETDDQGGGAKGGSQSDTDRPIRASMSVGVIVEKRASKNVWIDEIWMPVGVVPAAPVGEAWRVIHEEDGLVRYVARVTSLTLHRSEVEAYKLNLSGPQPHVYVVLSPDMDGDMPYEVILATCAPYEAEGYMESGGEIVEPVPMPDEVAAWVKDFIDDHYHPEPFIKRKRDKAHRPADHKFGKEPIFEKGGRYASGTDGERDDG